MNLEDYKELKNKRYSPKETLAYFIVSSNNVIDKSLGVLINSLEQELFNRNKESNILEKIDATYYEKIINYWSLSMEQVLSYAYIVFNNLLFENKEIVDENITDMFIYVMRLYSPNNAEEFVITKYNKKNL